MKIPSALIGAAILFTVTARGQVLLSTGTTYTQNFDTLASTASTTNTTIPWTNNVTLPGWYARGQTSGDYISYRASAGENTSGWIHSFGTNGVHPLTDRALGSIASIRNGANAFGVRFKNDTSKTMSNITISYTGEQWRIATGNPAEQSLTFWYRIESSPITNPDPAATDGWTAVSALNFTRLKHAGGTSPLDGNDAANRTQLSKVVLPDATLKPGDELFLRWQDLDDQNQSDHALAVDDLTVSFAAVEATAKP